MIRLFGVGVPLRTLLLVASETALVLVALWSAIAVWFGPDADLAFAYDYNVQTFLVACAVCILSMYYHDLYESSVLVKLREVATRLIQVLGTVSIVLALIYFAYPSVQLGRGPFLLWIGLVGLLLAVWRKLFAVLAGAPGFRERVAILGEGVLANELKCELKNRPELGFELVEHFPLPHGPGASSREALRQFVAELEDAVRQKRLDRLVVAAEECRGTLPVEDLLRLKAGGLRVQDGVEFYEAIAAKVPVLALRPSSLLFSDGFQASPARIAAKRAASILLSVIGLVVGAPLLALIAVAIRLDSRGPVLFRQQRVGHGGRLFTLYKFRTMHSDADHDLPARPNDERITRVGRWLRRTRLDELPQLYNILRGDMDLIGPRPFIPAVEEHCARQIPFYCQRWNLRPGITGWAQVHNGYCTTLEENIEKLGYDLFYIKHMSVGLDLLILFRTTKILLLGRGAR